MKQEILSRPDWQTSLLKKHPKLNQMRVVPLDRAGLDMTALSEFIERCWTYDYGDEPRLRFSPEFLEWNMGQAPTGAAVVTGQGDLAGVILYFKRWHDTCEGHRPYAIVTGLSVPPEYRGQGIGQLLYLFLKPFLKTKGLDFGIMWFDIRHSMPGSSYKVFDRNRPLSQKLFEVPILVRILDVAAGIRFLTAGFKDRLSMRCTARIFPVVPSLSLPRGFVVEKFRWDRTAAYVRLMKKCCPPGGLVPAQKDFTLWQASKQAGSLVGFQALIRKRKFEQEEVVGLYFGRRVRLDQTWHYVQADGIMIHPDLSSRTAGAFIRSVESGFTRSGNCMGIAVPGTCCSKGLWRYGYLPATRHHLTIEPINRPRAPIKEFTQGWVVLR